MRIIAGIHRSRQLKAPKHIRPTEDKVKKAVFDIIGDVSGIRVLDLFAGSGSVGLEALSRGAKGVVFIENDSECVRIIQDNIRSLLIPKSQHLSCVHEEKPIAPRFQAVTAISEKVNVIAQNVESALPILKGKKDVFDIVFLDPPYYEGMAKKTLQSLVEYDIVSPDGLLIAQHYKKDTLDDSYGVYKLIKRSVYADTAVSLYQKQ